MLCYFAPANLIGPADDMDFTTGEKAEAGYSNTLTANKVRP